MTPEAALQNYLENATREFRRLQRSAEKSIAQLTDAQFFLTLDPESNSIAVIMKHISGNQLSRWSDFLSTDGEKPERNRDTEFELSAGDTKANLLQRWEAGWRCLFDALAPLTPADLGRTVVIRNEPHTVIQAINRQLTHYGEHVGQIVLLAKHLAGPRWQTLSIPRGQSAAFNSRMQQKSQSR